MTIGIDWPKVLEDIAWLMGEGDFAFPDARRALSSYQLAYHLKVARGTLRGWLDGAEPRWTDGERILIQWCALTGKARAFAPQERKSLSAAKN